MADLQCIPPVPENASIGHLKSVYAIQEEKWGCLHNTHRPGDGKNNWTPILNMSEALQDPQFLNGTTYWINEHMAVGHAIYDISIIQVLQSTKVDRIVLQRAPCINMNLCSGIGTFDSFFKGLYISMMEAAQIQIPIYVRFTWQERNMKPIYLSSTGKEYYADIPEDKKPPSIQLTQTKCFERVIRKHGFYPSLSAAAIQKFKEAAYKLVTKRTLIHHFDMTAPIVILFAHRGLTASRHIANVPLVKDLLAQHFKAPKYELRVVNTTDDSRWFYDQIQLVAEAHVVITEHGAFQSNMMYMRNASLLVDLQGPYHHKEFKNFRNLARMFGVYHTPVKTKGLVGHWADEFNVTGLEVQEVADVVEKYLQEKPFHFNVK